MTCCSIVSWKRFTRSAEASSVTGMVAIIRVQANGERDRVGVEGAAQQHCIGPRRIEHLHDVGTPGDGADRIAAADDLAEQRQVRRQPEPALLAAEPVAKPLHLVQDEQHVAVPGQGGHRGQEPGRGRPDPAGAEERFGEHGGDFLTCRSSSPSRQNLSLCRLKLSRLCKLSRLSGRLLGFP